MTDLLSELEQLRKEVTSGRWQAGLTGNRGGAHCNLVAWAGDDIVGVAHVPNERNAAYIVALVNAAPALLACVRAADSMRRSSAASQATHDCAYDEARAQLEERG